MPCYEKNEKKSDTRNTWKISCTLGEKKRAKKTKMLTVSEIEVQVVMRLRLGIITRALGRGANMVD